MAASPQEDVNVITFLDAVARVCGGSTSELISTEGNNISLRTSNVTIDPGTGKILVKKDGVLIAELGGEQSTFYYDCVQTLTERLGGELKTLESPNQSTFREHFLFGLASAVWDGELLYSCRLPSMHTGVSDFALGKTNLLYPNPGTEGWESFILGERHQDAIAKTHALSSARAPSIEKIAENHQQGISRLNDIPWVIADSLNDRRLQGAYILGLEYALADSAYSHLARVTMTLRTNRETGRPHANGKPLSGVPTGVTPGIPTDQDGVPIFPGPLSNGIITPEDRDLLTRTHLCAADTYQRRRRRLETHLRTLGWEEVMSSIPSGHNDIFLRNETAVTGDFQSFDQRVAPHIERAMRNLPL